MKRLLLGLFFSLWATAAFAQNPQCPTRPPGDSTNACASTAFVTGSITPNVRSIVCNGVTDQTAEINAAIADLNARGGGTVEFSKGICIVSETSDDDAAVFLLDNVSLHGQGIDVTTIKMADNQASVHVITSGGTTFGTAHNVGIFNLTVDGNRRGNSNGISIRVGQEGVLDMQVNTVAIRNSGSYAIGLQATSTGKSIRSFRGINIIMEDCGNDCIDVKNDASLNSDNVLDNVSVLDSTNPGEPGPSGKGGNARLDLRGPWLVSNLWVRCVAGENVTAAVQFGNGEVASPNGEGGHRSSISNFYISGCGPDADNEIGAISIGSNNVSVSNGYIEGTRWGIRVGFNPDGAANTNISNVVIVNPIVAGIQTTVNATNTTITNSKIIHAEPIVAGTHGIELGVDGATTNTVVSNSYVSGFNRGIRIGTSATNTTLIGNNFGTNSFNISDIGGANTRGFYNNNAELPLKLLGTTSGVISITPQAAAGTYNWNLPTSAGTSGQPLISGGGGASPMTFGTLGVSGGGTGCSAGSGTCLDNITGFSSNGFLARTGAGAYAMRSLFGTANEIDVTNGGGAGNPVFSLSSTLSFAAKTVTSGTFNLPVISRPFAGGSAPTLSSCGGTPAVVGTDFAGTVTLGSGSPTGCVITFSAAYTNAPICTVTWRSNLAAMAYTTSTTALTLTQTATSSNVVDYMCVGVP